MTAPFCFFPPAAAGGVYLIGWVAPFNCFLIARCQARLEHAVEYNRTSRPNSSRMTAESFAGNDAFKEFLPAMRQIDAQRHQLNHSGSR
ncbi:MAG: hypothetical protein ACLVJ6_14820 [Merdibacter sp.]